MAASVDGFYADVPVFRGFASVTDFAHYRSLPEDWWLGVADVVQSTQAIAQNRYKAVNMAGAAVIAGVRNALGGRDIPYVFGGDGASFAVSAADADIAREALAATATWTREELDLTMRVALVPVAQVRTRDSTCAWRVSRNRATSRTRCSPAAGSAGRKRR